MRGGLKHFWVCLYQSLIKLSVDLPLDNNLPTIFMSIPHSVICADIVVNGSRYNAFIHSLCSILVRICIYWLAHPPHLNF